MLPQLRSISTKIRSSVGDIVHRGWISPTQHGPALRRMSWSGYSRWRTLWKAGRCGRKLLT